MKLSYVTHVKMATRQPNLTFVHMSVFTRVYHESNQNALKLGLKCDKSLLFSAKYLQTRMYSLHL